jgi:integrase
VLNEVEQATLVGFLAGYRGFTRDAYTLDLRQFTAWCAQHDRRLFDVHRVDIECFARHLEDAGKARATVARRPCTIVGFYRYADEDGVIEHFPDLHIRRPRIDYESHVAHLDRNELGAILVTAGLGSARDHALVSLLALNPLRVSEAIGANIEALGVERGHRTLTVVRKGARRSPCRWRREWPGRSISPSVNGSRGRSSSKRTVAGSIAMGRGGSCAASPAGPYHQACRTAHPRARLHHRRPGRGGPAARRPGSGVTT